MRPRRLALLSGPRNATHSQCSHTTPVACLCHQARCQAGLGCRRHQAPAACLCSQARATRLTHNAHTQPPPLGFVLKPARRDSPTALTHKPRRLALLLSPRSATHSQCAHAAPPPLNFVLKPAQRDSLTELAHNPRCLTLFSSPRNATHSQCAYATPAAWLCSQARATRLPPQCVHAALRCLTLLSGPRDATPPPVLTHNPRRLVLLSGPRNATHSQRSHAPPPLGFVLRRAVRRGWVVIAIKRPPLGLALRPARRDPPTALAHNPAAWLCSQARATRLPRNARMRPLRRLTLLSIPRDATLPQRSHTTPAAWFCSQPAQRDSLTALTHNPRRLALLSSAPSRAPLMRKRRNCRNKCSFSIASTAVVLERINVCLAPGVSFS